VEPATRRHVRGSSGNALIIGLAVAVRSAPGIDPVASATGPTIPPVGKPFAVAVLTPFAYYVICPEMTAQGPNVAAFGSWLHAEDGRRALSRAVRP
jgi:hypothetical protein